MAKKGLLLSKKDSIRLESMLRFYERHKNDKLPYRRRPIIIGDKGGVDIKIFEVETTGTTNKWGWYKCKEVEIDSTKKTSESAGDRFTAPSGDYVEVFNLDENNLISGYSPALALYDLIMAWQIEDDKDNDIYVGKPLVALPRRAKINEAIPSDSNTIDANLILRNDVEAAGGELGNDITLNGIVTTDYLDNAIPRLKDNLEVLVVNIQGKWWITGIFQAINQAKGLDVVSDKLKSTLDEC